MKIIGLPKSYSGARIVAMNCLIGDWCAKRPLVNIHGNMTAENEDIFCVIKIRSILYIQLKHYHNAVGDKTPPSFPGEPPHGESKRTQIVSLAQ